MKLSIVLSTQPASFSALAYKGQLSENIKKIKALGYDGVELAVRDPDLLDLNLLKSWLVTNNLLVPAIGTGQAYGEERLSLTDPSINIRKKAIDRIKSHINIAHELKAVVIIGLIRGCYPRSQNKTETDSLLIESLQECASENKDVRLVIEPINRYETDMINDVNQALKVLENLNMKNVGILLDTFHMNIEEPSIIESIRNAADFIFHFHVADSNRWYPGAGHLDFARILDALHNIQYNGFISAEILPLPDPDKAAQETIRHLKQFQS